MAAWMGLVKGLGRQCQGMDFMAHPGPKCLVYGLVLFDQTEASEGPRSDGDLPMVAAPRHVAGFDLSIGKRLKKALFNLD